MLEISTCMIQDILQHDVLVFSNVLSDATHWIFPFYSFLLYQMFIQYTVILDLSLMCVMEFSFPFTYIYVYTSLYSVSCVYILSFLFSVLSSSLFVLRCGQTCVSDLRINRTHTQTQTLTVLKKIERLFPLWQSIIISNVGIGLKETLLFLEYLDNHVSQRSSIFTNRKRRQGDVFCSYNI